MKLKYLVILYFYNILLIDYNFARDLPAVRPTEPVPMVSVDKILAIIYHTEGSSIILNSDLSANLEGVTKTLDDVILERLMVIDAEILKIAITEADIDRHLGQVQKMHNLSHDQTVELFEQMGLTFDQARQQLKTKLMIDTVLDHRVKKKVIVSTQIIQKYYDEHPIVKEPEYQVLTSFIPHQGSSPSLQKIKIEQAIESGEINDLVKWSEPVTLKESEIATDTVKTLPLGRTTIANISPEGISVLRLVSKKESFVVPLKERELEITNTLGKQQYDKYFAEYKEKLFKMARIKRFN